MSGIHVRQRPTCRSDVHQALQCTLSSAFRALYEVRTWHPADLIRRGPSPVLVELSKGRGVGASWPSHPHPHPSPRHPPL